MTPPKTLREQLEAWCDRMASEHGPNEFTDAQGKGFRSALDLLMPVIESLAKEREELGTADGWKYVVTTDEALTDLRAKVGAR
jgi:hypothetical protein